MYIQHMHSEESCDHILLILSVSVHFFNCLFSFSDFGIRARLVSQHYAELDGAKSQQIYTMRLGLIAQVIQK